jgi:hypothetical protein
MEAMHDQLPIMHACHKCITFPNKLTIVSIFFFAHHGKGISWFWFVPFFFDTQLSFQNPF